MEINRYRRRAPTQPSGYATPCRYTNQSQPNRFLVVGARHSAICGKNQPLSTPCPYTTIWLCHALPIHQPITTKSIFGCRGTASDHLWQKSTVIPSSLHNR
ncbi:hypothetical protein [Microseira wollei]|uniref:hypothetical protein n=1 Tax=Microseira wollei TaxID=467598 RepID=UPI001CFF2AD5|nr:hypothetical protein [Microseira wollei]